MRSSVARTLLALLLSALSILASAQIKVIFPGPGQWETWIGPGSPGGKSTFKSKGEVVTLPLAGTENSDLVSVYDGTTGNLAYRVLNDIDESWAVKKGDFTEVAMVILEVTHKGDPVAAANVSLKTLERTQRLLLTPSMKGRLTFKKVAAGPLEITISTSKDGKEVLIPKQVFDLKLTRIDREPTFRVAVAEPVDTVKTTTSPDQAKSAAAPSRGVLPIILQMLIGLGAVGAMAYLAWRYLPGMKPKIDEQLARVGVQIPADQPSDPDPPVAPAPAPAPVEQIILTQSDPAPIAAAPAPMTPALNGPAGRFEIEEGETLITREQGAGMYLDSTTVSRRHAELRREGSDVTLQDLGSTNGTYVNGERISAKTLLKSGDRVQFGDVQFVVEGI
ncbi:MAG: FHA domain-containing protein [Fimbriimonadaceae bacterium]|nr:FHA domain-containing protein [Fimbriimonadaceae bacterium]